MSEVSMGLYWWQGLGIAIACAIIWCPTCFKLMLDQRESRIFSDILPTIKLIIIITVYGSAIATASNSYSATIRV